MQLVEDEWLLIAIVVVIIVIIMRNDTRSWLIFNTKLICGSSIDLVCSPSQVILPERNLAFESSLGGLKYERVLERAS